MKIKKTLKLIDYSQSFLVIIAVFLFVALIRLANAYALLVMLLVMAALGLTIFLFRSAIINRIMRKSAHPGLMYSVLDKLKYTEKFNLSLPKELLAEIDHPHYSTAEFLAENELQTEFGNPTKVTFLEKGLKLRDELVPWACVYAWEYVHRSDAASQLIVGFYVGEEETRQVTILLDKGMNKIDLLLLFAHFKGKYGAAIN